MARISEGSSWNAQAVLLEDRYRRPIMPAFHALFSAGGVAGALLASASMAGGLASPSQVILVTVAALAALGAIVRGLLPSTGPTGPPGPVFAWPPATLLSHGLLAFFGLLVEGAVGDWSAVYLHDALGATGSVAAIAFAAFSVTMAIGRFGGATSRTGSARQPSCGCPGQSQLLDLPPPCSWALRGPPWSPLRRSVSACRTWFRSCPARPGACRVCRRAQRWRPLPRPDTSAISPDHH